MKALAPLLLAVGLAACSASAPAPAAKSASAEVAPLQVLLVTLHRGRCFGACLSYTLEVYSDGTVYYEGFWSVRKDDASDRLAPAKVAELRAAIARSKFAEMPEDCCDCLSSDTSTITLTVADPPPARTIVDSDDDCPGKLTNVRELANAIDAIVDIGRWIGADEEREDFTF